MNLININNILDSEATSGSMTLPLWNNGASSTFHFHPSGDDWPSDWDRDLADKAYEEYGISQLTIVTNKNVTTYNWSD